MATFMVMEKREAGETDAEFVRERFSFLALIAPLLWLLWHRLWIEAGAYLVFALVLLGAGWLLGLGDAFGLLALPLNVFVALEAPALRQTALRRRGWTDWGTVEAGDAAEAETRYLAEAGHVDAEAETVPALPMRYTQGPAAGPALGLFSYPGGR